MTQSLCEGRSERICCTLLSSSIHFRCTCGNCVIMTSPQECRCCRERPQVVAQFADLPDGDTGKCITEHPGFQTGCLDPFALKIAYLTYRQQYGDRNGDRPE